MNQPLKGSAKTQAWREANPEKYKELVARNNAKQKAQRKENPEKWKLRQRQWNLKHKYGLTVDQYDEMNAQQNHVCYICQQPQSNEKRLAVDHCHTTGKVRKLLCNPCNITIEYIENSKVPLEVYTQYISDHTDGG